MRAARMVREHGFTLIEVLVASAVLVTIAVGVAQLAATATRAMRDAREHTAAVILAAAKIDQLRALDFTFEPVAAESPPIARTDITTDVSLETLSAGGPGLLPSPDGTLAANVPRYVDYLDGRGRWIGNGPDPPPDAVFIRRWAVRPLAEAPDRTLVLHVLVTTVRQERARAGPWRSRSGTDALLVSVRTRTMI